MGFINRLISRQGSYKEIICRFSSTLSILDIFLQLLDRCAINASIQFGILTLSRNADHLMNTHLQNLAKMTQCNALKPMMT